MTSSNRMRILTGVCIILMVVAIGVWVSMRPGVRPPPDHVGVYYTGPLKGKGAKVTYGDDNGNPTPTPAQTTAPKSATAAPGGTTPAGPKAGAGKQGAGGSPN